MPIEAKIKALDHKNSKILIDLLIKCNGLAGFENTVDCGSAVIFDADSGLCRPVLCSDLGC